MFYLISENQIIGTANTSEGLPGDWIEADLGPDSSVLYLESGEIKRKPDRPSDRHYWEPETLQWALAIATLESPPQTDWDGFVSDLRGSEIWVKTFQAACTSIPANAAWTLIQNTLTSTRHPEDLEFAIATIRSVMSPDFTEEDIATLNKILKDRGFSIVLP